ncbi:50S ribosomal protein L19 [Mesomycoplasma hyorhinis]|nr:50S ribosomal protein L19 [Mesomycoplasma hyorhinis]
MIMKNNLLQIVENSQIKKETPVYNVGDNVKVYVKIKEGNKQRIQIFEGLVISKKGSGLKERFVVRKVSYGIGIERSFPLHSPLIEKLEVVRSNKVRRAKLYFMRDRKGKSARLKEIKKTAEK